MLKTLALQNAIFNSTNFSSLSTDVTNKITPADISNPQELITRAKALSFELGTEITTGFEALVFKASCGIEDIYDVDLGSQGRQPPAGGGVGHGPA